MNPKAPPFFAFHFADYELDTEHLSTEQHGAYLLLIIACWKRDGVLPDNDVALASFCRLPVERWLEHRPVIEKFFQRGDSSTWTHKRVSIELEKARFFMEAGKRGANKRWGNRPLKVVK